MHPSSVETRDDSYERLEFLGDSVLGLSIVAWLYERYPDLDEGHLSRIRADVVSRQACARIARELDLGARIVADEAANTDLRQSTRVLAAALEAVLAALFLEHGLKPIRGAIAEAFSDEVARSIAEGPDPKTRLQELVASRGQAASYETLAVIGPPHERIFTVAALVDGEIAGRGTGRSKKDAEQAAALEALASIGA
jgi:ribonuclease-3